jgi:hypothetical protein
MRNSIQNGPATLHLLLKQGLLFLQGLSVIAIILLILQGYVIEINIAILLILQG